MYEKMYQTISEASGYSYIQIVNIGEKMVVNNWKGYLQVVVANEKSRILYYLMNLDQATHSIYFYPSSGHGQSNEDAALLESFFRTHKDLKIWTSTEAESIQAGSKLDAALQETKPNLSRISRGVIEGLNEEQIKTQFPAEYSEHLKDPYYHRFQRGEVFYSKVELS
jgi:hypothetical protein